MSDKTVIVCVAETEWQGRKYYPGEHFEGPLADAPVSQIGWAQRPPLPSETSPADDVGPHGRTTVSWRRGPAPAEIHPVVVGHDLLRGEDIVDHERTEQLRHEEFDRTSSFIKAPTKEEHWRRHLAYLRDFAPQQYQEWISEHPEDRLDIVPPAAPVPSDSPPRYEYRPARIQQPPDPAAVLADETGAILEQAQRVEEQSKALAEPTAADELEALLVAEESAELAGDVAKLAELRLRIEEVMR